MRKLFAFAICAALFASCAKDATDYIVTEYESSDIPSTIPYSGGTYTVIFKTDIESRAKFEAWQYRLHIGDKVTTELVDKQTESIKVVIDGNYDKDYRYIAIETAVAGEGAEWKTVLTAKQESALVKAGDYYWTKGNVALGDGKFIIAEKPTDKGLYFFSGSKYGIPSDGTYAGTAYTPEPVQASLAEALKDEQIDVCSMVSQSLRLPTRGELENLAALGFLDNAKTQDGILCMTFDGSNMLMPFAGFMGLNAPAPTMVSTYGAYWGNGENYNGDSLLYIFNGSSESSYAMIYFDLTHENTGSVRCVRAIDEPLYVSHSPESVADNKAFELTVDTTPGDFKEYLVEVEASDNAYDSATVTAANPKATITIPANESTDNEVTWKIFVNGHFTGKTLIQPALTNYAFYQSHTPLDKQTYEAFTLTVRCKSDMASFAVEAKGDDGTNISGVGSKDNLAVALAIPENEAEAERTFTIYVNGENTKQTIAQEGKPAPKAELSVVWSEGYLTVKDGAYAFADKSERGMYFKWKSKWAVPFNATAYQGKAYGPDEASYTKFADVPQEGDVDPCSLVAPAGTWYMPSKAQIEELATVDYTIEAKKSLTVTDGTQTLLFVPAGQMMATATKPSLPDSAVLIWSAEAGATAGKSAYMLWSISSTTGAQKVSENNPKVGMMVRCVRNK